MILKKINTIRRKVMPRLTKRLGKYHFQRKVKGTKKTEIQKILICRPNQRLGNMLLLTPLLQEVITIFPNCKIDIVVKGNMANQIFKEYKNISNIIPLPRKPFKELLNYLKIFFSVRVKKYDLVINGDEGSSSGRILTYLANAKYKIFEGLTGIKEAKDHQHMAKNNVYNLRHYLHELGCSFKTNDLPNLDLRLTKVEISKGKEILENTIIDSTKKTIIIFTFATGAKCYSKDWWQNFYEKLNQKFSSQYNILEVLPIENVSQIAFKATTFYSKDIREIATVISNAELFIGADSGIMHLASSAKTTTIGLFSVTQPNKYMPYGNKSEFVNTNEKTIDDYVLMIAKKLNSKDSNLNIYSYHKIK